jgi:hypothetical protein
MPIVLRPKLNGRFILVGEDYVYGIIMGEAIGREGFSMKDIKLELVKTPGFLESEQQYCRVWKAPRPLIHLRSSNAQGPPHVTSGSRILLQIRYLDHFASVTNP